VQNSAVPAVYSTSDTSFTAGMALFCAVENRLQNSAMPTVVVPVLFEVLPFSSA
jgi:hypothetical protein